MKIWLVTLILYGLSLSTTTQAALWQHEENKYLDNYDEMVRNSYSEANEAHNQELLHRCKGGILPTNTVEITAPTSILASELALQCSENDICIVGSGVSLFMDSSLIVGALIVKGKLTWNDNTQVLDTQYLCGGYVVVEEQGHFHLKTEKKAWIYIRNNGAVHPGLRTRALGSDARGGGNPILEIEGRELQRTWSLLSSPMTLGSTTMKLLHSGPAMGWQKGDRIAISPMERLAQGWGQDFVISDFTEDGSIVLNHPSNIDYPVDFLLGPSTQVGIQSPEVINLSRNIIISGDDLEHIDCDPTLPEAIIGEGTSVQGCRCSNFRSKCTVGLHTMQKGGGIQRIHNTRVEKCGQRGIEGKYCLHFHQVGECPGCSFENNAVEYSHQRGIIVHGSHLTNVQGNVLYNVRGSGIYIEDGNEMHNTLAYNVVICPYPFHDGVFHGCTVPGTSNALADTKDNQVAFFSRAGNNNWIGNRASNGFNGMFLKEGDTGRGPAYGKVCESAARLGRFDGNVFHSNGRFGTYALGFNYPKMTDQSPATNGFNIDKTLCQGFDDEGNTRGVPGSFTSHSDYGNAFVGHYSAGDLQYNGHFSTDNNNLMYWKETKNFDNGCAAHIANSYFSKGTMALPDHGTFLIEDTIFGNSVLLETNHHCNVGNTGVLCMPTYMLSNVKWQNNRKDRSWVQFVNGGGIFTLAPDDAAIVMNGGELLDSFLPTGYVSLVSDKFRYLLEIPGNICVQSQDYFGGLYHYGILCKVPLRALRVYTRSPASQLQLDLWWDSPNGVMGQRGAPTATEFVPFHRTGSSKKQGFAVPVIPGDGHSYRISLWNAPVPSDWVIEFSDPVVGNRWNVEYLTLNVEGRACGNNGVISSQHDRRFIWSGDKFMADEAWGNHGACVGSGSQPADEPIIDCSNGQQNKYGFDGIVSATECPEKCGYSCNQSNSFCDCGISTCQCKAGFTGENCEIDLCAASHCGEHGRCTAQYLGGALPVSSDQACICEPGWTGPLCDKNPCLEQGKSCGNGKCVAISENQSFCECDPGYSGESCDVSCDGICKGDFPYGCLADFPGKMALGCHKNGGCIYLNQGQNYPYDGFCTYRNYESPTSSPVDSPTKAPTPNPIPAPTEKPTKSPTPEPTPSPVSTPTIVADSCEGICLDAYPFRCAENVSGAVKYGCYPGGGCYYAKSLTEEYPYNVDRWCTYKVTSSPVDSPTKAPTPNPSPAPTEEPTMLPTPNPSPAPTEEPTMLPTPNPSPAPTEEPTMLLTPNPSPAPTEKPTKAPTPTPSPAPTEIPTKSPTPNPSPAPTDSPETYHCGCERCTDEVWNTDAAGHSCGARITWLQNVGWSASESEACQRVSGEFPNICGTHCNPDVCSETPEPTPSPVSTPTIVADSCEGICLDAYPFRCAENISGAVKYGCYPGGGCYYAKSLTEEYPYNVDRWCTYKVDNESRKLRGRQL